MSRRNEDAYRVRERALYGAYGLEVREHFVDVSAPATSVRVLDTGTGTGEPIIFIHGSPNAAATWLPLVAHLTGRRSLLLERPGAGLSSAVNRWTDHRSESAAVVQAVVDHFALDRVDLAGSSFGGLFAYNFARAQPQRVRSIIQLGSPGGPTVLGMPTMFRFLSLPLPGPMVDRALRPDSKEARKMFADVGHGAAVASGVIPDVVFDWYAALLCDTDTVPNLLREIRAIASPLGYRDSAKLDDQAIAGIRQPLLYLWGDKDPFAKPARGDTLAALGSNAMIEHFEDFGHLPWYDDASLIAGRVDEFLSSVGV